MLKSTSAVWIVSAALLGSVTGTRAESVAWTDWTDHGGAWARGALDVRGIPVEVVFTGLYSYVQTSGGTNYWDPAAPYLSSVVGNAPPASDVVVLGHEGIATIYFSRPVVDPLFALASWSGNFAEFGRPIEILSFGAGYFGNGTPTLNAAGTGFAASGDLNGVIRVPGTFDSISFWHSYDVWHGMTVGVVGLPTPEPSSYALMLGGLGMLGIVARRHRPSGRLP